MKMTFHACIIFYNERFYEYMYYKLTTKSVRHWLFDDRDSKSFLIILFNVILQTNIEKNYLTNPDDGRIAFMHAWSMRFMSPTSSCAMDLTIFCEA